MKGLLVILTVLLLIVGVVSEFTAASEQAWVNFYFSPDKYKFRVKGKMVIEYGNIPGGLAGSKVTLFEEWQETSKLQGASRTQESNEIAQKDEFSDFIQENGKFEKLHTMSTRFSFHVTREYSAGCYIIYHLTVENDEIGTIKKSFKVFYR